MELLDILRLSHIGAAEAADIQRAFRRRTVRASEVICREGDPASTFYFIRSGSAMVSKRSPRDDEAPLGVLTEGQCFGEIGLLEDVPRTAEVRALTELEVFELDRAGFECMVEGSKAFALFLTALGRARLLGQTALFAGLAPESLFAILDLLEVKDYPAGSCVFRQGDAPDAMYVIVKGTLRVTQSRRSGREVPLDELGPPESFGALGIIESKPRSTTNIALTDTRLLALSRTDFQSLLKVHPQVSLNMMRLLSRRVRRARRDAAVARSTSFFRGMTILTRPERCLSCKACEIACAVSKSRTRSLYEAVYEEPLPVKRIRLRRTPHGSEPAVRPEHCVHCRNAPCQRACRFDAIRKDVESGTIVIVEENCRGCSLCAKACPFNVITMVRSRGKRRMALKCTHCAEHQAGPACVRACPSKALVISLGAMKAD